MFFYLCKYLFLIFYFGVVLYLFKYEIFPMEVVPVKWSCPPNYSQQGIKGRLVALGVTLVSVCLMVSVEENKCHREAVANFD